MNDFDKLLEDQIKDPNSNLFDHKPLTCSDRSGGECCAVSKHFDIGQAHRMTASRSALLSSF